MSHRNWEYLAIIIDHQDAGQEFERLGNLGWELVQVSVLSHYQIQTYFKRVKLMEAP